MQPPPITSSVVILVIKDIEMLSMRKERDELAEFCAEARLGHAMTLVAGELWEGEHPVYGEILVVLYHGQDGWWLTQVETE
jgi:hypothetical protein